MNSLSEEPVRLIPQGLQEDLESLRDPWGLFVDPTFYDIPGSIYATAMLDGALGPGPSSNVDPAKVEADLCGAEAETIGEPWYSWAVSQVLPGQEAPCLHDRRPTATGDPENDIPELYAWLTTRLSTGVDLDAQRATARLALDHADRTVVDSPYVMWRWDQIEDELEIPSTASQRPAAAPAGIMSAEDLMEWWGYAMRCDARPALCDPSAATPDAVEITRAAIAFGDEISLTAAISMLRNRGADEQVAVLRDVVERQRDSTTGLIRRAQFRGQIAASYKVFLLDFEMYPGPVPDLTSEELQRRLKQLPKDQTLTRLQAIAILKAVDEEAFRQFEAEVDDVRRSLDGATVTRDDFQYQVDVATAIAQVGESPTLHLEPFPVEDDKSRFLARKALGAWTFFDNGEDIVQEFSTVRDESLEDAERPVEPVAMYVAGLQSLRGPGLTIPPERASRITDAASTLKGCYLEGRWSEDFFRFNVDKGSSCSLDILLDVSIAGYGVYP